MSAYSSPSSRHHSHLRAAATVFKTRFQSAAYIARILDWGKLRTERSKFMCFVCLVCLICMSYKLPFRIGFHPSNTSIFLLTSSATLLSPEKTSLPVLFREEIQARGYTSAPDHNVDGFWMCIGLRKSQQIICVQLQRQSCHN